MKTTRLALAIIFALVAAFVLHAQTNTDRSGYVTNANLLTPFTVTNSNGIVFTNAVAVKLMPNKLIYSTPNGAMGTLRLDSLPKDLQERFGYDPRVAQAADESDKQKKERQQQSEQRQREIAAAQEAQNAIWRQVEANRDVFGATSASDVLEVEQVTKDGALAGQHTTDSEGIPRSLMYFVNGIPNQNALVDGVAIRGPFYKIGTYTYTTTMGASKTIGRLTCSPQLAFNFYSAQSAVEAKRNAQIVQQQLEYQRQEAAVPKAQRDIVWQRVRAHEHEMRFFGGRLTVRQITEAGIVASEDNDTDRPGPYYFVKDCPNKDALYESSGIQSISPPFYEIGTYTYTTVMGASRTLLCVTCSKDAAFLYYLNH